MEPNGKFPPLDFYAGYLGPQGQGGPLLQGGERLSPTVRALMSLACAHPQQSGPLAGFTGLPCPLEAREDGYVT